MTIQPRRPTLFGPLLSIAHFLRRHRPPDWLSVLGWSYRRHLFLSIAIAVGLEWLGIGPYGLGVFWLTPIVGAIVFLAVMLAPRLRAVRDQASESARDAYFAAFFCPLVALAWTVESCP